MFYSLTIFSLLMTVINCQMVQYSRGWTNGKRFDTAPLGISLPQSELRLLHYPSVQDVRRVANSDDREGAPPKLSVLFVKNTNDHCDSMTCGLMNILRQAAKKDVLSAAFRHPMHLSSIYENSSDNDID